MKLLHFGKLNGGKILQPKVSGFHRNKPVGKDILWTSPLETNYGWKEWRISKGMSSEEVDDIPQEERWILELDAGARVAKVDTLDDLKALVARFPFPSAHYFDCPLDWPSLAQSYDAFWLTEKGQGETRFSTPGLCGWDCETVAVFNAAVVKVVSEESPQR